VAGLFAFAVMRWGPSLLRLLDVLMVQRDRLRGPVRAVIAAAVPLLFSFAVASRQRPADAPRFEHLTVLVGMVAGFVLLAPRVARPVKDDLLDDNPLGEETFEEARKPVGASV
jgi:hypothetical protein